METLTVEVTARLDNPTGAAKICAGNAGGTGVDVIIIRENLMRLFAKLSLLCAALLLGGCASVVSPVNGFWYTNVKGPAEVGDSVAATRIGTAHCISVLGLVATGDASIEAAARAGGITRIRHVDFESFSVLGFYASFTTIVHGE